MTLRGWAGRSQCAMPSPFPVLNPDGSLTEEAKRELEIARHLLPLWQGAQVAPLGYRVEDIAGTGIVSEQQLRDDMKSGKLPAWMVGDAPLLLHDDIVAYLRALPFRARTAPHWTPGAPGNKKH
jgi:hypothetical protein